MTMSPGSWAVPAARPTLEAFMNALTRLGTALGFLSERDDASTASARFREFGATGERVGRVLATVRRASMARDASAGRSFQLSGPGLWSFL